MSNNKILVIDDSSQDLMMIKKKMEIELFARNEQVDVVTCKNLNDGFILLSNDSSIKILYLDLKMPGLSGVDAVQKASDFLKTLDHEVKLYVLSGNENSDIKFAASNAGANAFLSKNDFFENSQLFMSSYYRSMDLHNERDHDQSIAITKLEEEVKTIKENLRKLIIYSNQFKNQFKTFLVINSFVEQLPFKLGWFWVVGLFLLSLVNLPMEVKTVLRSILGF